MLIKGCYSSIIISMKNSVMPANDKQMYKISYISNKFMPHSLMYIDNNTDGNVLYQ